jgi:CheY-like chemotaxis protein
MSVIEGYLGYEPARILAVDDSPAMRATWQALLAGENYHTELASNGIDALKKMRSFLPDLLLSDLRMPEMSGFELLAVVRKRFPHITTVAVSGELSAREISATVADLFLEKGSYSPLNFLAFIKDMLARSPLRSRLPEAENIPVCLPQTFTRKYGLTCSECLRFFEFVPNEAQPGRARLTCCPYCNAELPYFLDPIGNREALLPRPAA